MNTKPCISNVIYLQKQEIVKSREERKERRNMLKYAINPPPRLACIVSSIDAPKIQPLPLHPPNLRIMSHREQRPPFDPSIYRTAVESNSLPPPHFIPLRNAGRIDANHIFSQQSTVGRISNRRPIDSSPGDCRGFIIFPFSIFSSLKGAPSLLPRPVSSKGGNISWNFSLPVHCERE